MVDVLYACVMRTTNGDVLTDIVIRKNWLDVVDRAKAEVSEDIYEVHMSLIGEVDGEPTQAQRDEAIKWIARHIK